MALRSELALKKLRIFSYDRKCNIQAQAMSEAALLNCQIRREIGAPPLSHTIDHICDSGFGLTSEWSRGTLDDLSGFNCGAPAHMILLSGVCRVLTSQLTVGIHAVSIRVLGSVFLHFFNCCRKFLVSLCMMEWKFYLQQGQVYQFLDVTQEVTLEPLVPLP